MSGIGGNHQPWNKELDDKLLSGIASGKNVVALTVYMKMSKDTIGKRLKEIGFDGIKDARKILSNK